MGKRLDANEAAHRLVGLISGEIQSETLPEPKNAAAVELGRQGGKARAASLSTRRKRQIAKKAAAARWKR